MSRPLVLDAIALRRPRSIDSARRFWCNQGRSRIQADLTRDQGWEAVEQHELKWVNLVSVDDTWSAFSLGPYKQGKVRTSRFERATGSPGE